jgi:pyruvate formate lyase activating enzyme
MCVVTCEQGAVSSVEGVNLTDRARCILCGDCVEECYAQAREMVGREMSVAEVMAEIERDRLFYDESGGGVTFSGGEPLFQMDFLAALVRDCKEKEIHVALDTCGFATWEEFDRIREYVDLFLYDLKQMDDTQHRELTGVSNQLILSNLRMLSERGHDLVIRVPIIPDVNDEEEQVRQIGEFAASLPNLIRLDLLPYHHIAMEKYQRLDKEYLLREAYTPSDQRMTEIAQILRGFGLLVKIGG